MKNNDGISIITLVITIISIIILFAISIFAMFNTTDSAEKSKFYHTISEVQTATDIKRKQSYIISSYLNSSGLIEPFDEIDIINPIESFLDSNLSKEGVQGYLINLETLNISGSYIGNDFENTSNNKKAIFNQSDVFVYDKTGIVYYAKGYRIGDEIFYNIQDASGINYSGVTTSR